ncbi:MAG: hypothetical protein RJQ09_12005, partial [Cyclobacteriaceae bacterium]
MKLITNLTILFVLITNISFSQTWETLDITEFARIDFPTLPEITNTPQELIFNTRDSSAIYLVTVRDLSNRNINLTANQLPEFYQGVINGTIESSNGQLLEQNAIEVNNIPGVEILYFSNSNPQLPELRSKRILLVNQHLINIDFWTTEDLKQIAETNKSIYFNSLDLGNNTEQSIEPEVVIEKSEAFEQGYNSG